jgi:hypothetical protein
MIQYDTAGYRRRYYYVVLSFSPQPTKKKFLLIFFYAKRYENEVPKFHKPAKNLYQGLSITT